MSWESLGGVGNGQLPDDQEWILFCYKMAKEYLLHACGTPPAGCALDVFWQDHDYGSYPTLGLYREYRTVDSIDYLQACETMLSRFNEAVDWSVIKPDWSDEEDVEPDDTYEDQDEAGVGKHGI